jgi:hypothetical protein
MDLLVSGFTWENRALVEVDPVGKRERIEMRIPNAQLMRKVSCSYRQLQQEDVQGSSQGELSHDHQGHT